MKIFNKSEWKKVKLGDICDILDSRRIPISEEKRIKGKYPYYGANGIQGYINDYIFDEELVLLAEDGGNFGSKTKPIAYKINGKTWVNNHAHVLKAKNKIISTDFLLYSLMFYNVTKLITGTTRKKLTRTGMEKITLFIPNLDMQEKITNYLQKIEKFVFFRKNQLTYLKELNKSLFIKFNKNGVEKQLDEVADIIMGQSPLSQSYNIDKKGLPFYQGKTEFGDMYIKESNIYCNSPIKIAEKNDILMSVRAPVGDVNIAIHKSCIGRGLASIRAKKIDYLYLFYLLKEQKTRIEKMGVGSTFKAINKNNISSLKMSIVEMNKQNKIKKYLILTEKLSFEIEKSIKEAENLYNSLMNKYFD
ncbi:restriction endonuclease subunit S [Fusobacterium polymorphum]|uniref:Restriction endonuclease subunit S n=1 Tax=Fusobacterium nucleatum subsp. polymorphum TaxID=76857 RepID=A0A2C6CLN1_FUSNP|nr:restriction endonuclease subunit S [Fusobacterium polymorphum]PHI17321.1 restriction endonuclease subunit S [Fusobacterium polymorphum]